MTEKLKKAFDSMVVYKDLAKTNFFTALSLPSFFDRRRISTDARITTGIEISIE